MSEKDVELKVVKADEVSFVNRLEPSQTIKLTFKYAHNLRYPAPGIARAEMTLTAEDREKPENFRLRVVQVGVFSCPADMSREDIHVRTFKELFPFARALAASVTAASGVPPVMIPPIDIEQQNIYRIDFKPPVKPDDK